jgi:hypothetical protein
VAALALGGHNRDRTLASRSFHYNKGPSPLFHARKGVAPLKESNGDLVSIAAQIVTMEVRSVAGLGPGGDGGCLTAGTIPVDLVRMT